MQIHGADLVSATVLNDYQNLALCAVCATVGYNILVSVAIIARLWWAHQHLRTQNVSNARSSSDYIRVIVALVESGALYTLWMIAYLIGNFAGDVSRSFTLHCGTF